MSAAGPYVVSIRNDPAELETLAEFCLRCAKAHGVGPKTLLELNLVLDELCTNIMSYAYDDDREHWIGIRAERRGGMLRVEISDDGRPFDVTAAAAGADVPRSLEDRPVGGLGLQLVRRYVSGIEYRRENGRNITVIEKKIEEDDDGNS